MQSFITYKHSSIEYDTYGCGKDVLICLHGFGETASTFAFLEKSLGQQFTLIAINLPFHGGTVWNEGLLFVPEDLHAIINAIIPTLSLQYTVTQWSFLGYSMGGRIALSYYQQYPSFVKSIALVAPDGLHRNRWYWFATQTVIGNRLFKWTMQEPQWFLGMVKMLGRLGLLNKSIAKFVTYYLGDVSIRTALYKRWTTMRKCKPHLSVIKKLIGHNATPTHLLFGKFDRIILYQRGEAFQTGQTQLITVTIINAGHQLLQEKYAAQIAILLPA